MAVTHKLYGPVMKNIASGAITQLDSTAILVSLMATDWSAFNQDNEYWATISTGEKSTDDYTPGGVSLDGRALAYADRITTLTATSETVFTSSGTISSPFAVVRATCHLISCIDFDGVRSSLEGKFAIAWADNKVIEFEVSS